LPTSKSIQCVEVFLDVRVEFRRMKRLSTFAGLALLFLVVLACKKGEGSKCYLNKDCKDNLVCLSETHECASLEKGNTACAASTGCKAYGNCKVSSTVAAEEVAVCIAKSEDDCKQSDCAKDGCTFDSARQTCVK